MIQVIGAIGEWILGNTFSCAVFFTYGESYLFEQKLDANRYVTGAFWLAQGASLMPFFAVGAKYSSTGNSLEGVETAGYHATAGKYRTKANRPEVFLMPRKGLYYVVLAIVTFVYLICSIRTNVCLFLALLFLVVAYNLYAAVHFYTALGNGALATKLEMVCDEISDSPCAFYSVPAESHANFSLQGCGCMQFRTLHPDMVCLCGPNVGVD